VPVGIGGRIEPAAVVPYRKAEPIAIERDPDIDPRAPRVTQDVVHRLLVDQENLPPDVVAKPGVKLGGRRRERQFDRRALDQVARDSPHAVDKVAEPVAPRVDRPDDVAHRIDKLAGGRCDRGQAPSRLAVVRRKLPARHLAQDGDARKSGADVIVQVARDPRPETLDLEQAFDAGSVDDARDRQRRGADGDQKPGLPPERSQHFERHIRGLSVATLLGVDRPHGEPVGTGGEVGVRDRALGRRLAPVGVRADEHRLEAKTPTRPEVRRCKRDFEITFVRADAKS
jgi:hypothetical protein